MKRNQKTEVKIPNIKKLLKFKNRGSGRLLANENLKQEILPQRWQRPFCNPGLKSSLQPGLKSRVTMSVVPTALWSGIRKPLKFSRVGYWHWLKQNILLLKIMIFYPRPVGFFQPDGSKKKSRLRFRPDGFCPTRRVRRD